MIVFPFPFFLVKQTVLCVLFLGLWKQTHVSCTHSRLIGSHTLSSILKLFKFNSIKWTSLICVCLLWLQSIYSVYGPRFIQPFICLLMNIWFILSFFFYSIINNSALNLFWRICYILMLLFIWDRNLDRRWVWT